jgi:hypothetical protein
MKSTWIYRITAVIFILFAAGHTLGFLTFVAPTTEGQSVFAAMNSVNLHLPHTTGFYTYGGFYRGFGLTLSFCQLLGAFICWHLSVLAAKHPAALGALPWLFFLCQLASCVITWRYFPAIPSTFSTAVTLLIGTAAFLAPRSSHTTPIHQ